ncbi:MAG: ATP-grasp domain-containing protein [bacterium]
MILSEYQSKQLCRNYDIPIPFGFITHSKEEALQKSGELGFPCVLKAQVPLLNRSLLGGIRFAETMAEFTVHADNLFSMSIHGHKVKDVLIERKISFACKINIYVLLNCAAGIPYARIEIVDRKDFVRFFITPDTSQRDTIRQVRNAGIPEDFIPQAASIFLKMQKLFIEKDMLIFSITPLGVTQEGACLAGDIRIALDDFALYRQKEFSS